jgi:hypothetical protein
MNIGLKPRPSLRDAVRVHGWSIMQPFILTPDSFLYPGFNLPHHKN